jgi:competence protein ComEC
MVALALGLLALRWLPWLPSVWLLALLAVAGVLLLFTRCHLPGWFLLGLCWACTSAQWALDDRLAPALDGETVWLEGHIAGLPAQGAASVRFELADASARRGALPRVLRLSWRGGPALQSGQRWRLAVTLRRPTALLNPAGFDSQAWLLSRRIGATGSVKAGELLAEAAGSWRQPIRQRLLAVDAQGREGTLAALILGDTSAVSRANWQTLQATGTVHLLVVSGQHVGMLAAMVYGLIAGLARLGWWPARMPWLPWACGLAFAAALGYGLLAGFQVPVRRACIMLGMVLLWRLRYRHLGLWLPWLAAMVLVLLAEPLVSLQPGFWLSFSAVAVLILAFAGRLGRLRWWQAWGRAQWCVAIGLLPAMLALGLPVSLTGPLANLVAVPVVSLGVLPAALLGAALLPLSSVGESALWLAGGLLNLLFAGLAWLAELQPAWLPLGVPAWAWALIMLGALLVLLPAGVPLRPLGWPLLALALYPPQPDIATGRVLVTQLDVGQGLAVLLRTRQHSLLYDAGPRQGDSDMGERVVVPVLRHFGLRTLDLMVLSHAHLDHTGGAGAVNRALPVGQVIGGETAGLPAALNARPCESGAQWQWDGVQFSLWRWADARDSNPASCVLLVQARGERLLLVGDIDAAAEQALINSGLRVDAHWLQSPHHGSRTSSSKAFLQQVRPQGVLISRGQGNGFGHPHPTVMARYRALGIVPYDTAELGALSIELGAYGKLSTQRDQRRFWRDYKAPAP